MFIPRSSIDVGGEKGLLRFRCLTVPDEEDDSGNDDDGEVDTRRGSLLTLVLTDFMDDAKLILSTMQSLACVC